MSDPIFVPDDLRYIQSETIASGPPTTPIKTPAEIEANHRATSDTINNLQSQLAALKLANEKLEKQYNVIRAENFTIRRARNETKSAIEHLDGEIAVLKWGKRELKLKNGKLVELVGKISRYVPAFCNEQKLGMPCTCGLTALRAEIERVKGTNPQTNFNQT